MPPEPHIPTSADIDKALKEFEAMQKGGIPQTSTIPSPIPQQETSAGITFETENLGIVTQREATTVPKMVQLVIKYSGGAITEQRQAEWILFGFVVVVMGISLFLFFGGGSGGSKIPTPPPTLLPPSTFLR